MFIIVRYENGTEGRFGKIDDIKVAIQFLAILAGKANVISATIEENRIVG